MKELKFHCVVCGDLISPDRITRKAVTCSDAHAKELKNARRQLRDMTRCRLCNRPSTPEERRSFTAWRKTLGVKRGWKTGHKRGPKKKPATQEHPDGTPIEAHLGIIQV